MRKVLTNKLLFVMLVISLLVSLPLVGCSNSAEENQNSSQTDLSEIEAKLDSLSPVITEIEDGIATIQTRLEAIEEGISSVSRGIPAQSPGIEFAQMEGQYDQGGPPPYVIVVDINGTGGYLHTLRSEYMEWAVPESVRVVIDGVASTVDLSVEWHKDVFTDRDNYWELPMEIRFNSSLKVEARADWGVSEGDYEWKDCYLAVLYSVDVP